MDTNSLILNLPASHQAAFSALNCEKMLPSVAKFDEEEEVPAISSFKKAIDVLYAFSLGLLIDLKICQALKKELEALWPDLDESKNEFASYSFDAFATVVEALNFMLSRDAAHVIYCSTAVTDTVDMYVQMASEFEPPASELESFIRESPFMIRELERQKVLLEELAKIPVINLESIAYLKELNEQKPLIDLDAL